MSHNPSAAPPSAIGNAGTKETRGMLLGLIGVAIFSLTLPFTRLAVAELDATFVALGRALVAALLAAGYLYWKRAPLPPRAALLPLALVAAGCVIGFPWLTSIAMQTLPAAHGAVLVGILPLVTALFSTLRGKEQPTPEFWLMAVIGAALVVGFALRLNGGVLGSADLAMLAAVLLGGLGYAEGGKLARTMGGQQVISWALVLSAPLLLPLVLYLCWAQGPAMAAASALAWLGFAYVSVFSMLIGFFFWYSGMAQGGVARVGQVQLLQPFLTLLGAALLLGEKLEWQTVLFALAVLSVVMVARQMQVQR